MKIKLNGSEVVVPDGASIAEVVKGQPFVEGGMVSVARSMEQVRKETAEFEITTNRGSFVLELNSSPLAKKWKTLIQALVGKTVRWHTSKVTAIGSFPTDLVLDRTPARLRRFDCFLALGGFDPKTTYMMIARLDHEGVYGLANPVVARVTRGRHVLTKLQEGDAITKVEPVVMELTSKDAFATNELTRKLEDGMSVETYVGVKLDKRSPVACEHLLVAAEKGFLPVNEKSQTFTAASNRMDVSLIKEHSEVRQKDMVTVRNQGGTMGRIYFYNVRRQISPSHSTAGMVSNGRELIRLAPSGSKVTVVTDPARVMVVGLTQSEAQKNLEARGLKQARTGDAADDSIVVEQEPELTMHILEEGAVETFGVHPEKVVNWELFRDKAPNTVRYLEKISGLDHKPIGAIKVHFTFEDMPMITFEGEASLGASIYPENIYEGKYFRGDIAITNMSRPNRGLLGLRLQDSEEFGPTGEEPTGTTLIGRMRSDIETMMHGIKEEDIIYIREVPPEPETKKKAKKAAAEGEKPEKPKKPAAKKAAKKAEGEEPKAKTRRKSE
jgi:putative methanogenesis marker protein 3